MTMALDGEPSAPGPAQQTRMSWFWIQERVVGAVERTYRSARTAAARSWTSSTLPLNSHKLPPVIHVSDGPPTRFSTMIEGGPEKFATDWRITHWPSAPRT
jgi:hypothetical protein